MGDVGRPFDNRVTIGAVVASVLLVAVLIVLNQSRSDADVQTAGRLLVDTGADKVVARQLGSASAGRQFVSPSLTDIELIEAPVSADELALADQEPADPAVEVLDAAEEREPQIEAPESDPDVAIIAAPAAPPTTLAPTTTQAPSPARTSPPAPAPVAPQTTQVRTTTPTTAAPTTTQPRVTTTAPATTTTARPTATTLSLIHI